MKQWMIRLVCSLTLLFAIGGDAADVKAPNAKIDKNSTVDKVTENITTKAKDSKAIQWLDQNLGHDPLGIGVYMWQILGSFLVILIGLIVKRVLVNYIEKKIEAFVQKTEATWDDLLYDAVVKPINAFIMIVAVHVAVLVLVVNLAKFPLSIIGKTFTVCLGFTIIWLVYRLVNVLAGYLDDLLADKDQGLRGQFMPLIRKALRIFVVVVGALTILATIGVNITGLAALLSVGALAFSMGAKDTVANLVGTFNILSDRPYKVGDWITVGSSVDGDVEEIGFRSTKIRMFDKTLMTVPNGTLATETIKNWSQMPKRRIKMTLGLSYDANSDQVRKALKAIETILKEDEGVDQEYMLVQFTDFGPSTLDVFLYYFSKSTVWKEYLETRQRVNLKIMDAVEELGLEFAFPTQTMHLKGDGLKDLKDLG